MKRSIRFRIWDKNINSFYEPVFNASEGQLYELLITTSGELCRRGLTIFEHESIFPDRYIIQQFTGLQDSNGKPIYDGDILLMHTKNSMSDMEVKFQDGMFVGEGPFNTHPLKTYFDALVFESIEVTGNIYENKTA